MSDQKKRALVWMLVLTFLTAFWIGVGLLVYTETSDAHYSAGCHKAACKLHVIAPYRTSFLGPTGACESGGTRSLRTGLRAVDPSGTYLGRYQFDLKGWHGAGGEGSPVVAGWLEQAYRAVVWLHRNGRQSWPNC
jgi:hypothetical protein